MTAEVGPRVRPNPFAFPSDTTFRFVLLIGGVAGVTPFVWEQVWLQLNRERVGEVLTRCMAQHPAPAPSPDSVEYYREYVAAGRAVGLCLIDDWNRPATVTALAGVGLVFAVATALYWVSPWWVVRRHHAVPLPVSDMPHVHGELQRLEREAGVPGIHYVMDPLSPHVAALAFGRVGRQQVLLHRGLVDRAMSQPSEFRAILRHELSHLRNRDVSKVYFTIAVWYGFIVAGLVPFAVLCATWTISDEPWSYWGFTWRILALGSMVALIRYALLRVRESYADVRASLWDEEDGRLLDILSRPEPGKRRRPIPLRRHPSPQARRASVENPQVLLRLTFWDALAVGIVARIGYAAVEDAATSLSADWVSRAGWWTGVLYGPAVAAVVGLGVWRAAYADHMAGRPGALRPDRVGLGLGLGLAIGTVVLLDSAGSNLTFMTVAGGPASPFAVVVGSGIVVVGVWLLVRWLASASVCWMAFVVRCPSPRLATMVAFPVAAFVCGIALYTVLDLQDLASFLGAPGVPQTILNVLLTPVLGFEYTTPTAVVLTLVMLTVLWVVPLLGAHLSARTAATAPWSALDGSSHVLVGADVGGPQWRRTLRISLLGSLALTVLVVGDRVRVLALGLPVERLTEQQAMSSFYGRIVVVLALSPIIVAVVTAARITTLRVAHALCGAFVVGAVGLVIGLASVAADACGMPGITVQPTPLRCDVGSIVSGLRDTVTFVLRAAEVLALVAAVLTAGVASVVRGRTTSSRRRHDPDTCPVPEHQRLRTPAAGAGDSGHHLNR